MVAWVRKRTEAIGWDMAEVAACTHPRTRHLSAQLIGTVGLSGDTRGATRRAIKSSTRRAEFSSSTGQTHLQVQLGKIRLKV